MDFWSSEEFNKLLIKLDEETRATPDGNRFIEPSSGVLEQSMSKRNHIIFGRRGSGKSSLIQKAKKELYEKSICVFIDVEKINENKYPDVLIIVLYSIFEQFISWKKTKKSLLKDPLYIINKKKKDLTKQVINTMKSLNILLYSEDFAQLEQRCKKEKIQNSAIEIGMNYEKITSGNMKDSVTSKEENEIYEKFKRSKISILNRNITKISKIINEITSYYKCAMFVFVDDLYHIPKKDQPDLLGFLQKIAKNNNTFLKIGTVRYRSNWFVMRDKPIGLKIGDDTSDIDLDMTLEKFGMTKTFLIKIINGIIKEINVPRIEDLVNPNALDRLIIASGGVSRDFLNLCRKSMHICQNRLITNPKDPNGNRVCVEDVNNASGEYGETKFEEFRKDSHENSESLRAFYEQIRDFCINKTNSNCFLVESDSNLDKLDEIIDLKLVHRISPRVTVSKRQGQVYKGMMLDLSQYAGTRTIRNFNFIEFWRPANREALRRISLILPTRIK